MTIIKILRYHAPNGEGCLTLTSQALQIDHLLQHEVIPLADIASSSFISGTPDGAFELQLKNQQHRRFAHIFEGRVADFLKYLPAPPKITVGTGFSAATQRGKFPEINPGVTDDYGYLLQQALNNGEISQMEYDDYHPGLPKAGK